MSQALKGKDKFSNQTGMGEPSRPGGTTCDQNRGRTLGG